MLRGFIGDENFKYSLRVIYLLKLIFIQNIFLFIKYQNHIKKYMYSNCDMEDLWEVITKVYISFIYTVVNDYFEPESITKDNK